MAAYPWYLLAVGIGLVILGYFLGGMTRMPSTYIDARMSDDEIVEQLEQERGPLLPAVVIWLGFLCVLVSIVWRIARIFVR